MAGYKKLIVWQKADDLAYKVYVETKGCYENFTNPYEHLLLTSDL